MGFWSKVRGVFGRIGQGIKKTIGAIGAPAGAIIGSLIPGIGTALGTAIGGAAQTLANRL